MLFGLGEMAGIATAVSWAVSCQIHTMAGRLIGATEVTVLRAPLFIAAVALVVLTLGADTTTPPTAVFFLACSALAGLAIADPVFYMACVTIGPRLTLLVQGGLTSMLTALLGYVLLGEHISLTGFAGICITSVGVVFVLLEGGVPSASAGLGSPSREQWLRGICLAFAAALALAASYLCMKQGMRQGIDPLWAAMIRITIGGALLWTGAALRGRLRAIFRLARETKGIPRLLLYGCGVSTVGNCLSLFAMHHAESGVVAALIGLQPVAIIPIVALVERKYPTLRAMVGTCIAVTGMMVLFLR